MNMMTEDSAIRAGAGGPVVATVLEESHAVLDRRVRLAWPEAGRMRTEWALTVRGISPRPRDRVIAIRAEGCAEPVVTAIVDGLHREHEPLSARGPELSIREGEALRIAGPDGTPWLEIAEGPEGEGPRLRLLVSPEGIDMPGVLRLAADAIELAARGEIRLEAGGDAVVKGETVELN